MKTVTDFPRKVKEIENLWIPMSDGVRLAARMWIPEDAEEKPVPAIVEYLPYRKRDGTIMRDALTHPYFAGHGYAAIRVDLRSAVLRPRKYGGGSSRRCARRLPLQAIPPGPRQPRRPPSSLPLA